MNACEVCAITFTIDDAAREFYQKINVPEPRLCSACRFRRRALWRNERTLYSRACDLCKKTTLSMYAPSSPYIVYCHACYFSDAWSPLSYGRPFDSSRKVMEQFKELLFQVPKLALGITGVNVNSEYQNWAGYNKDCYMVFNCGENERLMYARGMRNTRDSLDCYYGVNAELSYECVGIFDSSRTSFAQNVRSCLDCWFIRDCIGCTNCFGCVNLRYKDYYFLNEPLSKDDYERRVQEIVGSFAAMEKFKKEFDALSRSLPFKENHNLKSEDCSGDYIVDSKGCHNSFEVDKGEQCANVFFTKTIKDSADCIGFGYESELLYEAVATGHSHRVMFSVYVDYSNDCMYCHTLQSCSEVLLSDGLRHSQNAIFNTIYPEDEYRALKERVLTLLKEEGAWGEFFSPEFAPFAFNESIGMDYFPLSKEDARVRGYRWRDDMPGTIGKETLSFDAVPDTIKNVPDSITKEICACEHCGRNYKIISQELAFYRTRNIPIPRSCFNCRHERRLAQKGPMNLFDQKCAECKKPIKTTMAPDEHLTVLCEQCYTATVS